MGLVTRGFNFSPNTTIASAQVNTNETTLYSLVNGNIDSQNVSLTRGIGANYITASGGIGSTGHFQAGTYYFTPATTSSQAVIITAASGQTGTITSVTDNTQGTVYFGVGTAGFFGMLANKPQTVAILTGSGTYTTPILGGISAQYLVVKLVGGGGSGAGGDTGAAGTVGNSTLFGTLTATGGLGGKPGNGAFQGQGGAGGTAVGGLINASGGAGGPGIQGVLVVAAGGAGGCSVLGGGGQSTPGAVGGAGAQYGGGGGGGGVSSSGGLSGGGGGGGSYLETYLPSPAGTYGYTIATSVLGGAGAGNGFTGGAGGGGVIFITSHWT